MKNKLILLLSILLFLPGCFYMVRYDATYKGTVVDAETGEPIEGVVVLGVWYKEYPTPAGAVSRFYDAKETVTGKDGEFAIQGIGLRVFTNIVPMHVLIFKAGYKHIGMGPWESFKWEGGLVMDKIKWEGDKPIIPLKKLTMEERKKMDIPNIYVEERVIEYTPKGLPVHSLFIPKNIKLIVKEINKELMEQGRKPLEGE